MHWSAYTLILLVFENLVGAKSGLSIDCEKNAFELDGRPFRYIAGEIHYFRIPRELWEDRVYRYRAAGLNAVQIYVAWNFHEESQGRFNFDGDRDLAQFIKLCQKYDLYVLLRVGPYICAEWENGGHPAWLLSYDDIQMRSDQGPYLAFVEKWLTRLGAEVLPLQYPKGPILAIGVENEYGLFGNNSKYTSKLSQLYSKLGYRNLYTTDPLNALPKGKTEGAFSTSDFGVQNSAQDVQVIFSAQRKEAKCGPYVNSEFYPAWFDKWGWVKVKGQPVAKFMKTMMDMINLNASLSIYMFHGGSNFGFWPGKDLIQSYDYSAPLSEGGQVTESYLAIRKLLKELPGWDHRPFDIPKNHSVFHRDGEKAYRLKASIPEVMHNARQNCVTSQNPLNFEKFNQSYGYALYWTTLKNEVKSIKIDAKNVKDLAHVYIDNDYKTQIEVNARKGAVLTLLVEEIGRFNYGPSIDKKGLLGDVEADGTVLSEWNTCGVDSDKLLRYVTKLYHTLGRDSLSFEDSPEPGIFVSEFELRSKGTPQLGWHTFIDMRGWGQGQLFVNEHNLGRFWSSKGPQQTLFVPGVWMKVNTQKHNLIVIFDFEPRAGQSVPFGFVKEHIWT